MGLLSQGKPLSWEDTKKYADLVRKVGIQQLVAIYHRMRDRTNDPLKFGDEIEYTIVRLDHEKKVAQLALIGPETLDKITSKEEKIPIGQQQTAWSPEYAAYQIEGIPGTPYGDSITSYCMVESNMKMRRHQLLKALESSGSTVISITGFPRLGCPGFTHPQYEPTPSNGVSNSLFFPDEAIWYSHPRFKVLTENIRLRRGENQVVNTPVYKDKNTPNPFVDQILSTDKAHLENTMVDHLYFDCAGFGAGMCCLQVTIQAANIDEARLLYDQLAVISPILLAISAATPACKGYLCDSDCRWNFVSGAMDDRTKEERGLEPLKKDSFVIPRPRWDSIPCYIHPTSSNHNDEQLPFDEEIMKTLQEQGFDEHLAHHFAYLFIRDPLQLFEEKLHQDPEKENDHFENIYSTNWNTMRFKPPPPESTMGWRVEFRPLEVQLTDFENAAFVVFVVILTRSILSYGLDFRIPISKLDENMKRAVKRDTVNKELFHFRKVIIPEGDDNNDGDNVKSDGPFSTSPEYKEMDINTIINGNGNFLGLIPMVQKYVNSLDVDADTHYSIQQYLKLIQKKAAGELLTTAKWIRNFITQHCDYKEDSIITEKITYDLMVACDKISRGDAMCAELTGTLNFPAPSQV
ncbi:glutamate--cysteine ligase catalytic subunit-like [Dysidea avara]|uniref:glutamate--cysteine ligase catalytic subunit-like n=1 Tax=Dysidea avara TaxID=196820 RepID=UPI0033207ECF